MRVPARDGTLDFNPGGAAAEKLTRLQFRPTVWQETPGESAAGV